MLGRTNPINPFHQDFYCCKKCYSEYREIYQKCRKHFDSSKEKDWNKRFMNFWLNMFFGEFLKDSINPSFRTFTVLK